MVRPATVIPKLKWRTAEGFRSNLAVSRATVAPPSPLFFHNYWSLERVETCTEDCSLFRFGICSIKSLPSWYHQLNFVIPIPVCSSCQGYWRIVIVCILWLKLKGCVIVLFGEGGHWKVLSGMFQAPSMWSVLFLAYNKIGTPPQAEW